MIIHFAFLFLVLVIGRNSLVPLWRKVMIDLPSNQDLINVVLAWYPGFELLATKLIGLPNICDS